MYLERDERGPLTIPEFAWKTKGMYENLKPKYL